MKVQVTFTFEIDGDATKEDIESLVSDAFAQFDDPRDSDGERVDFAVSNLESDWFEVA